MLLLRGRIFQSLFFFFFFFSFYSFASVDVKPGRPHLGRLVVTALLRHRLHIHWLLPPFSSSSSFGGCDSTEKKIFLPPPDNLILRAELPSARFHGLMIRFKQETVPSGSRISSMPTGGIQREIKESKNQRRRQCGRKQKRSTSR